MIKSLKNSKQITKTIHNQLDRFGIPIHQPPYQLHPIMLLHSHDIHVNGLICGDYHGFIALHG